MLKSKSIHRLSGSVLLLTSVWLVAGCGIMPLPEPIEDPTEDPTEEPLHKTLFTDNLGDPNYQGTQTCLTCHSDHATDIMETGHWNWSGAVDNVAGLEGENHGKVDLVNDY
ncbi:MAG: hypothetical protein KAV82_06870 [Phycisphaerae bacterium]|nr:hypothetical protein [Phycisphaerae bacterium]